MRYSVSVNRSTANGLGTETVAIFVVYDDGETEPEFLNPPDPVLVASLRRALDLFELQAEVAAGRPLTVMKATPEGS